MSVSAGVCCGEVIWPLGSLSGLYAVSNLDQQTAEHFARTINKLKGKVTMLFITHQIPRGLQVDEVIELGTNMARQMEVVEEER